MCRGRDQAGASKNMNPAIPNVTPEELAARVRTMIQDPLIETATINPEYGSWSLRVTKGKLDIEYVWGPLSGFGARDLARPITPDDTPFDYADEYCHSLDEALNYLKKLAQKYEVSTGTTA